MKVKPLNCYGDAMVEIIQANIAWLVRLFHYNRGVMTLHMKTLYYSPDDPATSSWQKASLGQVMIMAMMMMSRVRAMLMM